MRFGNYAALLPAGLARRLARAFVGLVAAALAINGAINMWLSYEEATNAAVGVQREKALAAAERVGQFVGEIESQMGWTTRAEWARVSNDQRRYDFIRLLRQAPAITEALFIDGMGREQLRLSRLEPDAVGSGADLSNDPRFLGAVADKVWYGPVYFRRGSEPYMTLSLAHAGRNPAVTSVGVNLKLIWDVIAALRVGEQGYAYVTDAAGRLIAHPDMSLVLRETDLSRLPQVARAIAAARGEASWTSTEGVPGVDGRIVLSSAAVVPRLGWLVLVEMPRREVLAPVLTTLYQTLALLGLSILFALLMGGFLARRMAEPIRQLQAGAERLGEGELSQRVAVTGHDEIGKLAERFNIMASRIQEAQETLERKVEDRTADLNESLAQQTASADVLEVISRSPSEVKPVLDAIVAKAAELCEAEFAYIARPDDGRMKLAAASNMDQDHMRWFEANPIVIDSGSITGRVAMSKETIHVEDVLAFPAFKRLDWQKAGQRHTVMGVPLLRNETLLGVIILARKEVRPFTDKQIRLVETFADQAVIAMENTRLFNETQESLQQQTASADILRVISQSVSDTKPVFDKILESCKHLFHGDETDVLLVDEQGMLQIAAYDGKARAVVEATFPAPWEKTPAAPAIRDRRVVNYADVLNNPDTPPVLRRMGKRLGYHSVAFAPMVWEDRGIGVVGVARSGAAFTTKELTILQGFADQAVIAIQNSRLFNETQEALEQQKASADVLEVISGSMADAQPVFDIIAERAATLCNAIITAVSRFDGEWVHLVAYRGVSEEANKAMLSAFPRRLDGTSISARAIRERVPVQIHDVALDASYGLKEEAARAGYHGNLAVPMIKDGTVVGAIVVCRAEAGPFPDKQVKLLQTFADQAVIAIENARLFEEVQQRTRDLEKSLERETATGEILASISGSMTDPKPVFDAIVRNLSRLFDTRFAVLQLLRDGVIQMPAVDGEPGFERIREYYPRPLDASTAGGQAMLERRVVHYAGLRDDPATPSGLRDYARDFGFDSVLFAPMLRGEQVLGAIGFGQREAREFDADQVALINSFADQAVIAIENARLFAEVQARTKELEESLEQQTATADVLQVISRSAFDLQKVLDTLIETAVRLCGAFRGVVFLRRGDVLDAASYSPGYTPEIQALLREKPLAADKSSRTGRALMTKSIVHVSSEESDPPTGRNDVQSAAGFKSLLAVPLMTKDEAFGVFTLTKLEAGGFTPRQIELAKIFADQAVIAIENARLFEEVQAKTRELEASLADLTAAQTRLIQSEKLASLGQLTAGIAHEIKNPLNFVNNFADLSSELVGEIEEALTSAGDKLDPKIKAEVEDVAAMLKGNLAKIVQHGRRADSIVKNMLAHSRESGGELRMVDVNATVEEALNLAYHGARAEKPGFNITLERDFDPAAGQMELYPQEFTRVLLNLIGNGFHAANKKRLDGAPDGFEPILRVTTKAYPDKIVIAVRDNGTGIPDAVRARIFEPFFTTKPTGEGTGLGLSLSHDIVVKQHGGKLDIVTEPGEFTEFTVTLPRAGISSEARR